MTEIESMSVEQQRDHYKARCEEMQADISAAVAGVKTVITELGLDVKQLKNFNAMTAMGMLSNLPKVLPTLSEKLEPLAPLIEKYGSQ